jgi:molybdopterin/thiamine biosynthesis adenylyltransferase
MLNDQQIERYSRQIILPQLGGLGQETLLAAAVAIIGRDDLSTVAAAYLAGAGVGRLALSAAAPLAVVDGLNPDCRTSALPTLLTRAVADEVAGCDAVVVCGAASGTWQTLNAACIAQHTPLLWGETAGSHGLVAVLANHRPGSPCYSCLRAQAAQLLSGGDAGDGLADATAAFVGTVLATEAIKVLIGVDAGPAGLLLKYHAGAGGVDDLAFSRDPRCPTCGVSGA